MVYSSKDKIKKVKAETPSLTSEPGFADKMARNATTAGQTKPRKGFSSAPKRGKGGVSGVPKTGKPDAKPSEGAPMKAAEASRTQDGRDVFAMKPDEWNKRQAKILGRGRVL